MSYIYTFIAPNFINISYLMTFGIVNIFQIFGALAFFIFGMKMMSEGIQRAAGDQLRNILQTMTKNRFFGLLTGFFTTALVQSSSATTVMTVSFVNAGLVTLVQSAGIMMGANIGTTVTAWIISIIGQVSLSSLSIPLFAVGVPMLFRDKGNYRYWGEFIIGFGILFLSINFLQNAIPSIEENTIAFKALEEYTGWGIFSRIIFVFIGALVALVLQSSTAAMAITMALCVKGWLPIEIGAAMVLGENIGTTVTAEVASLVGNTAARRAARIHSIFNLIGVFWMIILLPMILPLIIGFVEQFRGLFVGHVPIEENLSLLDQNKSFTLAAFHTVFNLLNVLFLIGFVPLLVKVAIWSVRTKEDDEEDSARLKFISSNIRTPELATIELMKETSHFGEIVQTMHKFCTELINSVENKTRKKLYKKIRKYEKITDRIEIEITEYVTKLTNEEITQNTSKKLRSILNVCNDLERIGDIYYQISKTVEEKNENRIYFLPQQRNNLNEMLGLVAKAHKVMNTNLASNDYSKLTKEEASIIKKQISKLRNKLREDNLSDLSLEGYNVKSAMVYNNIFISLSKIGDNIMNVTESLVGEI